MLELISVGYVTGCSLWIRKANTAAKNGVFYGFLTETSCMIECLTTPQCVAIDLGPNGCVLHNNVDDLATAFNVSGVTHLVLNRHCLPTTARPTAKTTTIAVENYTDTTVGKNVIET